MPKLRLLLTVGPGAPPFRIQEFLVELSRVPNVGEVLGLGSDEEGIAADYEVALVHHLVRSPTGVVQRASAFLGTFVLWPALASRRTMPRSLPKSLTARSVEPAAH